jgi:hypothetical protein
MVARGDNGLVEYLAENYGECTLRDCRCLKTSWLGTACQHWRPCGVKTWDELYRLLAGGSARNHPPLHEMSGIRGYHSPKIQKATR